jgi:hypothetical protein
MSKYPPDYTPRQRRILRFLAAYHKKTVAEMEAALVCTQLDLWDMKLDLDGIEESLLGTGDDMAVEFPFGEGVGGGGDGI